MQQPLNSKLYLRSLFVLLLIASSYASTLAQEQTRTYNRFQYHKYKWKALPTASFHIYYPEGYDSLCKFASVQLPDIMEAMKKVSGIELQKIPNIILYPSISQQYESNIGLHDDKVQTFPTINLKGNRAVVSFSGSYQDLKQQLAIAIMRLGWEDLFKNNPEEQLTNKAKLIPEWYKEGVIHHFAEGWPLEKEEAFQKVIEEKDSVSWQDITSEYPVLSGQAFCYFLSVKYRQDAARQILSQLRQGKSLSRAARLVTKQYLDSLTKQCIVFYQQRAYTNKALLYSNDIKYENAKNSISDSMLKSIFSSEHILNIKQSPDSKYAAITTKRTNKRLVYLIPQKAKTIDKPKPIYSYLLPPWMDNHDADIYPIITWAEHSNYLFIAAPEKGKIAIKKYTLAGQQADSRVLYGVDGISALEELKADEWMMAAFRRGQSDIVSYKPSKSRFTPFTNDLADNTQFSVNRAGTLSIACRSGYPADSLFTPDSITKPYGIYVKNEKIEKANTNNTQVKSSKGLKDNGEVLIYKDSLHYSFQQPVFVNESELSIQHNITGYIIRDIINIKAPENLYDKYTNTDKSPWLKEYLQRKKTNDSIAELRAQLAAQDVSLLGKILEPGDVKTAAAQKDSMRKAVAYHPQKIRNYILSLHSAYFSASINNDYYINRYQPYKGYLGSFKFPEVGAMVQGGFSDVFENHHFNIGYRMPSGMEGSDFFFRYENTKLKVDWHFMYFRKVESLKPDPDRQWFEGNQPYPAFAKVKTYYYELGFHYPLHYDWGLDFNIAARNDKTIFPATDRFSLNFENLQQWWNINSLVLKADKLQPTIPMLYKGWQGSFSVDGFVSGGKTSTILYGSIIKFSYHQPIYKHITLVVNAHAGHSGGEQKVLYNFGGLDNNIVPRVDTSVQFTQDAPYAFQSLVTPFRGYRQNSIYGSSYGLVNADVYVPLFKELIPLQTSFSMLNALQLGVFADIAATRRTEISLPVSPSYLYSYGLSARTMLAGYGIRFDIAWPEKISKQPVWYLSLIL